jgi:hypothetical protein
MNIIDHGKWTRYHPSRLPEEMPPNALYSRRESDQKDWYDFLWKDKVFKQDTVKATANWTDNVGVYVIGAATYDGSMMFPHDSLIIEIEGYTGVDPQKDLGGKSYDPQTQSFGIAPVLMMPPTEFEKSVMNALEAIAGRLEALEKKPK